MLDIIRRNAQSWGVKILFGLIILVFVFWGVGSIRSQRASVLAHVNDTDITVSDFKRTYQQSLEDLRRENPDVTPEELKRVKFKHQVLSRMVNTRLLLEQANKLGLAVSPRELRLHIGSLPAFQSADSRFDPDRYKSVLRANRLSPGEFEARISRDMLLDKLKRYLGLCVAVGDAEAGDIFLFAKERLQIEYLVFAWEDFRKRAKPTQEDINAFYMANQERFKRPAMVDFKYLLFTPKGMARPDAVTDGEIEEFYKIDPRRFERAEGIKVRHILIKVAEDAKQAETKAAEAKLIKLLARLKKGAKFEDLAKKYSQGPSADQGGDLGWLERGATVKAFEDAAFALGPGQVSQPVRTMFGWHIIKVEDRREKGVPPLDEIRGEVRQAVAEEKAAEGLSDALDQALEQVMAGDGISKIASDLGVEPKRTGHLSKEQAKEKLGLEVKAVEMLFSLVLGQVADTPISVDQGYMLAENEDVRPEAVLPLDRVKDAIFEVLVRREAMKLAREKAESVLADFSNPDRSAKALAAYKKHIKGSEPFGRQGFIPGLGMNPALVKDAYAAKAGAWLPQAYAVENGFVLAGLKDRIQPSKESWEKEKGFWIQSLEQSKGTDLFQAYLAGLHENADIGIVNPQMLE
ncbi:MAG: SurA N-terminal domain-containing protein [Thermodesulfobacteriota bacterium]|nr:SurA N-terminal domain-containing protein [Thermodesulfobacteriota bacterium]